LPEGFVCQECSESRAWRSRPKHFNFESRSRNGEVVIVRALGQLNTKSVTVNFASIPGGPERVVTLFNHRSNQGAAQLFTRKAAVLTLIYDQLSIAVGSPDSPKDDEAPGKPHQPNRPLYSVFGGSGWPFARRSDVPIDPPVADPPALSW
jgi:hypothetical protein